MSTLGHERVGTAGLSITMAADLRAMVAAARSVNPDALRDPLLRDRVGRAFAEIELTRLLNYRALTKIVKGQPNWPEVPLAKLQWSSIAQTLAELAVDLLGPAGLLAKGGPDAVDGGQWARNYSWQRYTSIGAGATEIQKNIIAKKALRMNAGKPGTALNLTIESVRSAVGHLTTLGHGDARPRLAPAGPVWFRVGPPPHAKERRRESARGSTTPGRRAGEPTTTAGRDAHRSCSACSRSRRCCSSRSCSRRRTSCRASRSRTRRRTSSRSRCRTGTATAGCRSAPSTGTASTHVRRGLRRRRHLDVPRVGPGRGRRQFRRHACAARAVGWHVQIPRRIGDDLPTAGVERAAVSRVPGDAGPLRLALHLAELVAELDEALPGRAPTPRERDRE